MLSCIFKVLECFFAIRTSPLTDRRIDDIENMLFSMANHFIALFQLKQKFCGIADPKLPLSRKLHDACCVMPAFMRQFGTTDHADTASWESVHRRKTKGLWNQTSKRRSTMANEMAQQSMLLNYQFTNAFLLAVHTNDMASFVKNHGPYQAPQTVVIENISNLMSYDLQ